jgi:2-methylcitrate dehydratase PrpD
MIMGATYKPYPASAEIQKIVHLVLKMMKRYEIDARKIVSIIERASKEEVDPDPSYRNPGPFTSRLPVIASAPFNIAAALLRKPITDYTFFDNYNDPEVLALARKVKLVGEKERKTPRIEIILQNGESPSIEESGFEFLVPTRERIEEKFTNLASKVIGKVKTDAIIDISSKLDSLDNIRELTRKLTLIQR